MSKDVAPRGIEGPSQPGREVLRSFEELLGDFPDGAVVFDAETFLIVAANQAYCKLIGYTLDELMGISIHSLGAEPQSELDRRTARFLKAGRQTSRGAVRRRSGEIRLVEYTAHKHAVSGCHLAFVRDITDESRRERDLFFRAGILDSIEDGVYVLDRSNVITMWNRAAEEITGFSATEVIGKRVEDLGMAPQAEFDAAGRRVLEAISSDRGPEDSRPRSIEITGLRRRKDGSIFSSWAEVTPLRDDSGAYEGVVVMLHDLSRDRDREPGPSSTSNKVGSLLLSVGREAIAGRGPETLLAFAVDQLGDSLKVDAVGCWRIDARSGELVLEAGRGWPGERTAVPLGHPDVDVLVPDVPRPFAIQPRPDGDGSVLDAAGIRSGIVAPIQGGGRSGGSIGVFTSERRHFPASEVEAVAAVAELISAARARVRLARIEGDLDIARRQASLGALISGVAHDFNNMLSVMLGYARLMEPEAAGSELLAEGVAEIEVAARQAMRLSRGLVDLGRAPRAEPEPLGVSGIVREVSELLHRMIGEAIVFQVDDRTGRARVLMPRGELDRVIVNLVANARDALPDGGTILLRARAEPEPTRAPPERVVLEVVDDGIGMTPGLLAKVREPSFTTKPRREGSGIGLPSVETILRAAGGSLELESTPGRGTTARVIVPALAD